MGTSLLKQGVIENQNLFRDVWGEEGFAGPLSEREARLRGKMEACTLTLHEWSWEKPAPPTNSPVPRLSRRARARIVAIIIFAPIQRRRPVSVAFP